MSNTEYLDHFQIYMKIRGTRRIKGTIDEALKDIGYLPNGNPHTYVDPSRTIAIKVKRTKTRFKSKYEVPIHLLGSIQRGQNYNAVLSLQTPRHRDFSRRIYGHYNFITHHLNKKGIQYHCPNPPKDKRKGPKRGLTFQLDRKNRKKTGLRNN